MESTKVVESTKILHETSTKFVESMEKLIGLCPLLTIIITKLAFDI